METQKKNTQPVESTPKDATSDALEQIRGIHQNLEILVAMLPALVAMAGLLAYRGVNLVAESTADQAVKYGKAVRDGVEASRLS